MAGGGWRLLGLRVLRPWWRNAILEMRRFTTRDFAAIM
jgi:hypothetical protein